MVTSRLAGKGADEEDLVEGDIELNEEEVTTERLAQALAATISGEVTHLKESVLVTIRDTSALAEEVRPGKSATKILATLDESILDIETRIKRSQDYLEGKVNIDTVTAAELVARSRFERMAAKFSEAKSMQNEDGLAEANAGVKDAVLALIQIMEAKAELQ